MTKDIKFTSGSGGANSAGEFWGPKDHDGHETIFATNSEDGFRVELEDTRFGKDRPRVQCDSILCIDCLLLYTGEHAKVWNGRIIADLELAMDNIVVGRIDQGEASGGNNPPWVLAVATDKDVELVNDALKRFLVPDPTGRIEWDARAIAAARRQQQPEQF